MKKSINLLALLFILLCTTPLFAQADPGDDPAAAPIDAGITLLLAAGALYGAKKVNDKRKK